ncbi:MAG TPA: permease, partial [Spirochaetota bacterium]|nr:permease [Spirochaetota bacterium]
MKYKNFTTAMYCTVHDVENTDWENFGEKFSFIEKWLNVDKVYLESYRSERFVSEAKMRAAKDFFTKKGIACSGGITLSAKGRTTWDFRSFCYSDQHFVDELVKVIEFNVKHFDETILDDFYFTNCKCDSCIAEKGDLSWDEYRTVKLRSMSELMVTHARTINPKATVIIKYPNWYDDYQYTGYNLRDQRQIHGTIYTGTETRDPALTQQNLPRYLSYFLMRYMENALPGKNAGGWFDPYDCSYNLNSYLEQAYLTLFSKAREVTTFCLGSLMTDFREFVPLAGYAFDRVDSFMDKLGKPQGIACYKPFNSDGENYLLPALGMLGIPLEPTPFYPEDASTVILSESAACDDDIVDRIKKSLQKGKTVVITSGLARALEDRGLRD